MNINRASTSEKSIFEKVDWMRNLKRNSKIEYSMSSSIYSSPKKRWGHPFYSTIIGDTNKLIMFAQKPSKIAVLSDHDH